MARPVLALVAMPYTSLQRPSLALGLLKAVLEREGLPVRTLHPYLDWAEEAGLRRVLTCTVAVPTDYLVGEWTFSEAAFRQAAPDPEAWLAAFPETMGASYSAPDRREAFMADLRAMRARAPGFVDRMARRVLDLHVRAVGCTSTFSQHVASLALLRRVKELDPTVATLLGGANCEADMGEATHRNFPWVDFVVSGEAEEVLPGLVRRILAEGPELGDLPPEVLGPRDRGTGKRLGRGLVRELDALPVPDFDDYFRDLETSVLRPALTLSLPLETSRGCWWGARHRCSFCGLNGQAVRYRSKSPERALAELHALESRYGIRRVETVDNIMDQGYFRTVLPALAQEPPGRKLFYEVKANLKREQVEALARAGVTWIQPGIESLSTPVLGLMNKGVQAWQNLLLLRHAREFGVRVSWSFLWGFPGEEDEWYAEMARFLPLLEHLQPPSTAIRMRVDRFGSYHTRALQEHQPLLLQAAIRHVYPLPDEELHDLSYFFRFPGDSDPFLPGEEDRSGPRWPGARPGFLAMYEAACAWRSAFQTRLRPVLAVEDDGQALHVLDTRRCAPQPQVRLEGAEREALLACEPAPLAARVREAGLPLDALIARRLVLEIDRRALALPVRGNLPAPPGVMDFPGGWADYSRAPEPALS